MNPTDWAHRACQTRTPTDKTSFWLAETGDRAGRRPHLRGPRTADVCIVGAGYSGLWLAYELLTCQPSLSVVVLESAHVGFGASGRNGGWVTATIAGAPRHYQVDGADHAQFAHQARAGRESVDEVGRVIAAERIDCDFSKDGAMQVAQTGLQMERVVARIVAARQAEDSDLQLLSADEVKQRVNVAGAVGGSFTPHCARVHPAKLVIGLADAVERRGGHIYERTPVLKIRPGEAVSANAVVKARFVIRATEGYTRTLQGLQREILPMNSSMLVTEPLDARTLHQIDWPGAMTLATAHHRYCYLQRTADDRIAIGGRGIPYRYGSATDREGPVPLKTVAELRARLVSLFPILDGVAVAESWHGVLGVARDWCPSVGLDRATGLGWAGGYVGAGLAASNLAARTLRDLILGRDSALTRLPWVGHRSRAWEPEPFRFLGTRAVWALFRAADQREARVDRPALAARLAEFIAGR